MKTWIVLLLSILTASAQDTDFLTVSTNIDATTIVVKHRGNVRNGDIVEFHGHQGGKAKQFKHLRWSVVKLNGNAKHTLDAYKKSRLFEHVEFAQRVSIVAVPNDPLYPQLWGLQKIKAPQAWDRTTGSDVIVAVIDTGIDFNHPDLRDNLWTGPIGEHGYTAAFGSITEGGFDDHSHGTHVAGTIGAVGNNGIGVAGVNWWVKLMSFKFLGAGGSGSSEDAALCIEKMVDLKLAGHNIRVSNNSWGGGGESKLLEDAFALAEQAGILNICAAGNEGQNNDINPQLPSSYPLDGIIAVLASDDFDNRAFFSNYGEVSTDLFAPGVGILSTKPGGDYQYLQGTSMAAPHVAGVAAALFGLNPNMNPLHCKSTLLNPDSFDQTQFVLNSTFGGRLNFAKAVNNPYLFSPSNNHNPTLTLSTGTNIVVVEPGKVRTITAIGTDPDGDVLRYSSAGVSGKHLDDWLIEKAVASSIQSPVLQTNIITITNRPSAMDFALTTRFGVTDGKGGGDVEKATIFTLRDAGATRTLTNAMLTFRREPNAANPFLGLSIPGLATNEGFWTLAASSGFQGYGQAGVFPVNSEIIYYRPVDAGPNLIRAYVMDTNGNFANSEQMVIDHGNTGRYYPTVRIQVNTLRGTAPLNVVADMSATDPGNAHRLWYSARYWRKGGASIDRENPVRRLTLTELGLHPIEFAAYDTNSNLGDNYVVLFTVLPTVQTEPPTEPPPISLVPPQDLRANLYAELLQLSWSDTAIGEDRYDLQQRVRVRSKWQAWKPLVSVYEDTVGFTFTPLPNTQYEFRLKACKGSTCSPFSNVAAIRSK